MVGHWTWQGGEGGGRGEAKGVVVDVVGEPAVGIAESVSALMSAFMVPGMRSPCNSSLLYFRTMTCPCYLHNVWQF